MVIERFKMRFIHSRLEFKITKLEKKLLSWSQDIGLVNNKQTSADKDSENSDSSVSSLSGRTDRQRVAFFSNFYTESGQRTDTGQYFPENPGKNETRTGHRRLVYMHLQRLGCVLNRL